MCDGWRHDFASFFHDMGPKPPKFSIERLNNELGYLCGHCEQCRSNGWPKNCEWKTAKHQAGNRRNTKLIEYKGESLTLVQWSEILGHSYYVLWDRLYTYNLPVEVAFSKPNQRDKNNSRKL